MAAILPLWLLDGMAVLSVAACFLVLEGMPPGTRLSSRLCRLLHCVSPLRVTGCVPSGKPGFHTATAGSAVAFGTATPHCRPPHRQRPSFAASELLERVQLRPRSN